MFISYFVGTTEILTAKFWNGRMKFLIASFLPLIVCVMLLEGAEGKTIYFKFLTMKTVSGELQKGRLSSTKQIIEISFY